MVKRSDSIGIPLPAQIHSAHKLRHKKEEYEAMITCKKSDHRADYAAPLLSNGELSVTLDYSGVQEGAYIPESTEDRETMYPAPEILLAGRRYEGNEWGKGLISYGFLSQDGTGEIIDWSQSLSCENASLLTQTQFENGLSVKTEAFVSLGANVLALRKTFSKDCRYTLTYTLATPKEPAAFPYGFTTESVISDSGREIQIHYQVDGRTHFEGTIRFICSHPALTPVIEENRFSFAGDIPQGDTAEYYLAFSDNITPCDIQQWTWDALYRKHCDLVSAYNKEGFVELDDEDINHAYHTASYHLRCVSTPWGIPTGIFRTHWNSVYFTFDEFYMLDALLSSNHLNGAKKSVDFRARTLGIGLRRAAYMELFPEKMQARYPWVADEDGKELSSPGYYNDHIFHMANVAIGAWNYYQCTADEQYFKEKLYPVIKACAGFYHHNMVYRLKEGTVIGHCTDLERLGPSIQNAYMTTCSAIALFRIFANAADTLGTDQKLAAECLQEAEELFESLPNDGKKYIAYPGYTGASVAVMTGTYPYRIHKDYSELEDKAVTDYIQRELTFGNMYAKGKRICSWYSLWKAIYFARRYRKEETYQAIRQSIEQAGAFYEMFEINEDNVSLRPWFATASAFLVTAVNESLLQNGPDGQLMLLPGLPNSIHSLHFRLSAAGATTVHLKMKNRIIEALSVSGPKESYMIELPNDCIFNGHVVSRDQATTKYLVKNAERLQ